jgi:hypothetical protein
MVVYVIRFRPFKSELQQVICASDEFTIIFGMFILYFLYYKQEEPVMSKRLGMALIGIVALSIVKNLSVIITLAVRDSYLKFRNWFHKKTGHAVKKKIRLEKEAKQRAEKEKILKEEEDLLRNGITIDRAPELNPSI